MNQYTVLTDGRYLLGSVFLIAVGFGVIIVGFLGIVAAIWESNIIATFVSDSIQYQCMYLDTEHMIGTVYTNYQVKVK